MTIIHMEPEQVRSVGRQLEQTADVIYDEIERLAGRVRAIPWQSPGRERYVGAMEQLKKQVQVAAHQGLELSRRVQTEVNEWEDAAASFGAVGAGAVIPGGVGMGAGGAIEGHEKPENMMVLAKLVMEGTDPIRRYEIGRGEYLLIIQGTSNNPNTTRNWGSAVATGLGLSTDYQEQVRLALVSLPVGAMVHMAGHSQGGIVAQNLAGEKSVQERVNVKSVTTFGSPYSASEVNGVNYKRYAAMGDPVPYLEGRDAAVLLLTPFIGVAPVIGSLANRHPQTSIPSDFSEGVFGPHGEYSGSSTLKQISGENMPFNVTTWNGQPTVYDPGTPHSGASVFYQTAARGVGNFFGNLF